MAKWPKVPGRGEPPNPSSVPGNVTAAQVKYYGEALPAILGMPQIETRGYAVMKPSQLEGVTRANGKFVVGATNEAMRRDQALNFNPEVLARYDRYATQFPTMDPRSWLPLAESGIEPDDQAAIQTYLGDRYDQFVRASYGGVRSPIQVPTTVAQQAANQDPSQPDPLAIASAMASDPRVRAMAVKNGWATPDGLSEPEQVAQEADTAYQDAVAGQTVSSPLSFLADAAENVLGATKGVVETVSRAALVGLGSLRDVQEGYARQAFGDNDRQYDIARKHGLTPAETAIAFPETDSADTGLAASRTGRLTVNTDPQMGDLSPERQEAVRAAQQEYQEQSQNLPSVWDQTMIGQVVQDPGLLTDPSKGGSGWLPSPEIEARKAIAAGKVFDVRTADAIRKSEETAGTLGEQAQKRMKLLTEQPSYQAAYNIVNGPPTDPVSYEAAMRYLEATDATKAAILAQSADQVAQVAAPLGWTPGRGLSAVWMDSDTLEYQVTSGITDFFNSLILDPANLIPAGKGVESLKALHPGTWENAVKPGSDVVMIRMPNDNFGGRAASFGAAGAKDKVNLANLRSANRKIYDAPGIKYGDNGRVVTPHTLFAVPENMARFLLYEPRGQRVVAELARMDSAADIMLRSNNKMPAAMASMLADADNPNAVIAAMTTHSAAFMDASLGRIGSRGSPMLFRGANMEDYARSGKFKWLTGGTYDDSAFRRFFREVPRPSPIHWPDKDHGFRQAYKWGNGIGLTREQMLPHLDNVLGAKNRAEAFQAYTGLMEEAAAHLVGKKGISEGEAKVLTRMFNRLNEDMTRPTFTTDLAPDVFGGDKVILTNEMLNNTLMLPDYRTARRAAGMIGAFKNAAGLSRSGLRTAEGKVVMSKGGASRAAKAWDAYLEDAMNTVTSYWKYSTLLRGAYLIRNPMEMSIAMSLAGGRGVFTHPFGFASAALSSIIARDTATAAGRMMKAMVTGYEYGATGLGQEALNVLGMPSRALQATFDQVGMSAAAQTLGRHMDVNQMRLTGGRMWQRMENDPNSIPDELTLGVSAFHGNLGLQDEPIGRQFNQWVATAHLNSPEQLDDYVTTFIDRLWTGHQDAQIRDMLDPTLTDRARFQRFRESNKEIRATMRPDLFDPDGQKADREFMRGLASIAKKWHQDDPVLMDAMLTGRYNGEEFFQSEGFRGYIKSLLENNEDFRANVPDSLRYIDTKDPQIRDRIQQGIAGFFESSADIDDLVRIPALRDTYLGRVGDMSSYLTREEWDKGLKIAREGGDRRMERALLDNPPWTTDKFGAQHPVGGTLSLEHVHASAAGAATKEAERIFYNAHRRQNWALALRVISPFAQSMANTWKRWGMFAMQNPQMAYRTLKPLQALMQPGSGVIYGAIGALTGDKSLESYWSPSRPDLSVDGFFYLNRYGQREFVYPGLGALAALLPFVDPPEGTQFKSTLSGLNVAGDSINPGFGPAVTFPASFVLEGAQYRDDPKGAILRALQPYGMPEGSPLEKAIDAFMPTMIRKFLSATDEETNMTMVAQTAGTLIASGKYDVSNELERDTLMHDAQEMALRMGTFSAIAGSFTPSTIQPLVSDMVKSGVDPRPFITQVELANTYRKYVENSPSYNEGVQNFIDDYGDTALFSVLPMRDTNGIQATNDVWAWRSDNEDSYRGNKSIVGLFFAGGDTEDFNQNLYNWQKADGDITNRDLADLVQNSQNRIATLAWNARTSQLAAMEGLSDEQITVARAQAKSELMKQYPGWDPGARYTQETDASRMSRLETAVLAPEPDEGLVQTPGFPYLKAYMQERAKAVEVALSRGNSGSLGIKANQDLASHMVQVGVSMMRRDPSRAFTNAWNELLSRELGAQDIPEDKNG